MSHDPWRDDPPLLRTGVIARPRWTRQDRILVAGLVLIAAALRLPGLDSGLWIDEIHTLVTTVRLPPGEIIRGVHGLNNHTLYSLCAHYSIAAFGESAWALRLPAVIFGVAAVPAAFHLGRQISSRPEAFLLSLFVVFNYHHVWFSQNARGYTALLLGAVLSTVFFIRLLGTRNPPLLLIAGYAIVAALSTWAHLTAIAVLCAHSLIWLALAVGRLRGGWHAVVSPPLAALLLAGALALALNAFTLHTVVPRVFGNWIAGAEVSSASAEPRGAVPEPDPYGESSRAGSAGQVLGNVRWTLTEFAEGLARSMPGGWVVIPAVIAVLVAGAISYARQSGAVLALLVLPPLITVGAVAASSLLAFPRFLFSSVVFLMLLGVRGGFALSAVCLPFLSRRLVLAAGIAVALAGATTLPAAWQPKQDWPAVAAFLAGQRAPDDIVACIGESVHVSLAGYLGLACAPVDSAAQLEALERQSAGVWLVYAMPGFTASAYPNVWAKVHEADAYRLMRNFRSTVRGGDIVVMREAGAGDSP